MTIIVRVKPNARVEYIKEVGVADFPSPFHLLKKADRYFLCAVSAPPEKGRANERLIELLAEHLDVAVSRITITRGQSAVEKLIEVH